MKKSLLIFATLLFCGLCHIPTAKAEAPQGVETTVTWGSSDFGAITGWPRNYTKWKSTPMTWNFDPGFSFSAVPLKQTSSAPSYVSWASTVLIPGESSLTITSTNPIVKLSFLYSSEYYINQSTVTANVGEVSQTVTSSSTTTAPYVVWTAPEGETVNEVVLTISEKATMTTDSNKSGFLAFTSLEAVYMLSDSVLQDPIIEPAGGTFLDETYVSVTCATADADIYYAFTTGAATPTYLKYEGSPINITKTGKFWAYSQRGSDISQVVTQSFTIKEMPLSIKEISNNLGYTEERYGVEPPLEFPVWFDMTVVWSDATRIFVYDGTYGYIYNENANFNFQPGDVISGDGWKAKAILVQQANEIVPLDPSAIVKKGTASVPAELDLTNPKLQMVVDNMYKPAVLALQELPEGSSDSYTLGDTETNDDDEANAWEIKNFFNIAEVEPGYYNIHGILYRFGVGTGYGIYLAPTSYEKVVVAPADPVISLAEGTYNETQTTTLSCATEGAAIYYTLDDTDPIEFGTLYNEGEEITISNSCKLQAVAEKYGDFSNVVSSTYFISGSGVETILTVESEATYFNLQGMPVSRENLSEGIYVEIAGGKARKIAVK